MMSSGSSTDRGQTGRAIGIQVWHFYILLSLAAATWAVVVSPDTAPAALLLLSAAIFGAGFVGVAVHKALVAFLTPHAAHRRGPLPISIRESLEADKALVLRSIKELEFDRAMGKVNDADFNEIGSRLRKRAMELMEQLDREPQDPGLQEPGTERAAQDLEPRTDADARRCCSSCGSVVDADARFCKSCGARVA